MITTVATAMHSPVRDSVVLIDILLHSLIGYLLVAYLTEYNPLYGAIGGLIPNIDLLFDVWPRNPPLLVHRGLLHTPFFLLLIIIGVYIVGEFRSIDASAIGVPLMIGYIAELMLDLFEGKTGVMLAYPFFTHHFAIPVPGMDYWVPLLLLVALIFYIIYWVDGKS